MNRELIEHSRVTYVSVGASATVDEIQAGCLQRIAAATELMCKDREKLERDYKYMRGRRDDLISSNQRLRRKLSASKGVATKLRNKMAAMENRSAAYYAAGVKG